MNEKLQKFIAENASPDTSGKWMSIANVEKLVQLTWQVR